MLAYQATATGAPASGAATYQLVNAALGESLLDAPGSLTDGVYHVFSSAAGEVANGISNASNLDILAHPSTAVDAPRKAGGTLDDRYQAKVQNLAAPRGGPAGAGIPTNIWFKLYPARHSRVAIIRNEELILLRAEARWFTNDRAGALADLNTIRTRGGGLPALAAGALPTDDAFISELLLQRRYSLLMEGHRWFDVRRRGRLSTLPLDLPSHVRATHWVVPQAECLARTRTGVEALKAPSCP